MIRLFGGGLLAAVLAALLLWGLLQRAESRTLAAQLQARRGEVATLTAAFADQSREFEKMQAEYAAAREEARAAAEAAAARDRTREQTRRKVENVQGPNDPVGPRVRAAVGAPAGGGSSGAGSSGAGAGAGRVRQPDERAERRPAQGFLHTGPDDSPGPAPLR